MLICNGCGKRKETRRIALFSTKIEDESFDEMTFVKDSELFVCNACLILVRCTLDNFARKPPEPTESSEEVEG